jgi:hypothetical protein
MGRACAIVGAAAPAVVVVLLWSAPVAAQPPGAVRARADALFREGRTLLAAGQLAVACAKLEESDRLDPKIGRLLNVAYCHEKQGRIASAWHEYDQAAAMAIQAGQATRERFARGHASALARQLAFLRLELGTPPLGAQVRIDDEPLAREQWSIPFAVDPGLHTVTVQAPGYKARTQATVVTGAGEIRVEMGALEKEEAGSGQASAAAPLQAAATAEAPGAPGGSRTLAWVLGSVGVVALGVGAASGLQALSLQGQADAHCPGRVCDSTGTSLIGSARTAATVSTIGLATAVVGLGAGAWLMLQSSPAPTAAHASVAPFVAADRAGIAVEGAW